jgi:hypothetical protein
LYYNIGEGVIIKNKVCFRQLALRPTRSSIIKLILSFGRCCFIPFKKKNDLYFKMAVAIPRVYVGASVVRRYFGGAPAERACVLPLRRGKAFNLPHEGFRRTPSFANVATRGLVRGGYIPPRSTNQERSQKGHGERRSMPEAAGTEQTCLWEGSLPSQTAPPDWSHPANRPIVTEQEVLMGSKQSFGGTHAARGTFRTQLQGSLQGVAKVLGALSLATLCSPPPALAPSLADATDIAGPDAFQKAQGTLMRIAKVVGALLLGAALALCTPRPLLAAQQRKAPASRSASTVSREGNRHSERDQSTSGGGPVQAVGKGTSASDEGVAVEAVVKEASATDQGGAAVAALEGRASITSAAVPVKTVVDESFSVTREGAPLNASSLGGAALGTGGEKAPATSVTKGVQRVGLAGGLGIRLKKAVDSFKEPLEETEASANTGERDIGKRGGAAKPTRSPPMRRGGSKAEAELASEGSVPSERRVPQRLSRFLC